MEEDDNICEKQIKEIIKIMCNGLVIQKIQGEGNKRNKSRNVIIENNEKIKLEIGSTVRPDPYNKRKIKTYIQEFLESNNQYKDIKKYELKEIEVNTLCIERTFIDKVMAVKRHAICGTLAEKTRHIYDVVRLYHMKTIQDFLSDKSLLRYILKLTKQTDSFYLEKREINKEYNPLGFYEFESWKDKFDKNIKREYENLHKEFLFTDEVQDFDLAIKVFEEISAIFYSVELD